MSYLIADWVNDLVITAGIHRAYASVASEAAAVATALGSDATTHDKTIEQPAAALQMGPTNSKFLNDLLALVNVGKGGNIPAATMGTSITTALTNILPPTNTAAPVATGTGTVGQTLTTTNGTWTFTPTSFRYRWFRGGVGIPGATASTYVLVTADSGNLVSCRVAAYNALGENSAQSNAITVA